MIARQVTLDRSDLAVLRETLAELIESQKRAENAIGRVRNLAGELNAIIDELRKQ